MRAKIDQLGAGCAIAFYISAILVFAFRLLGMPRVETWLGLFEFLLALPLLYLLITAPRFNRRPLYYIQIGLMLAWLAVEALLDFILMIDFRAVNWMVISYAMLFFAGTGGMLGVARLAGRRWSIPSGILFLVMAVLAFVQRAVTGM